MKNTILLCGGQKGGAGKTTAAVSLALMRKRHGREVILIDGDEQKNAVKWSRRRSKIEDVEIRVPTVSVYGITLCDEVMNLAEKYDDIVIDVPGHKSEEFLSALRVAHRLISPIRASIFDIETMSEVDGLVGMMRAVNPKIDAGWFLNMAAPNLSSRTTAIIETTSKLEKLKNIRPLTAYLCNRSGFELTSRGLIIDEMPKSASQEKGVRELKNLSQEAWAW